MCQHCALLKAVCASCKDTVHFSACLWPLPAVSTPAAGMSDQPSLVAAWRMLLKPAGLQGRPQARNRRTFRAKSCFPLQKWGPLPRRLLLLLAPLCFRSSAVLLFPPSPSELQEKGKKPWSAWGPAGWKLRQRTMVAFLSFSLVQLKKKIEINLHTITFALSKCTIQSVFKNIHRVE